MLSCEPPLQHQRHHLRMTEVVHSMSSAVPAVSVIVPAYNHARFIPERIDSILNQTFQDFELILLDDHSTDNTSDVLRNYAGHRKVSHCIINDSNSGAPCAQWKRGLELSRGQFVWIAESVVVAHPQFLDVMLELLNSADVVVVAYCRTQQIDDDGRQDSDEFFWPVAMEPGRWARPYINNGDDEIRDYLSYRNTVANASAVVFRRDTAIRVTVPTDVQFVGDWIFWVRMLRLGTVAFSPRTLSYFRMHFQTTRFVTQPEREQRRFEEYLLALDETNSSFTVGTPPSERDHSWILRQYAMRFDALPWWIFRSKQVPLILQLQFLRQVRRWRREWIPLLGDKRALREFLAGPLMWRLRRHLRPVLGGRRHPRRLLRLLRLDVRLRIPADGNQTGGMKGFLRQGEQWLQFFQQHCDLVPDEAVLEIGCGQGRVARPIAEFLSRTDGEYHGLDVVEEAIAYCQKAYRAEPHFSFHHIPVHNAKYNRNGTTYPWDYTFPFPDSRFSFVFVGSAFTHMLQPDVDRYCAEIYRVLRPGGRAVVAFFLLDHVSLAAIERGFADRMLRRDMSKVCRTECMLRPEEAVGYQRDYVVSLARALGFAEPEIHRGSWAATGESPAYYDVLILRRACDENPANQESFRDSQREQLR